MSFQYDVCVVGGCGHVGLPLAITFAKKGLSICVHDIDDRSVALVSSGKMPFRELGAAEALRDVIGRNLVVANDRSLIPKAKYVIIVIGTPVDEHLNPTFHSMRRVFVQQMLPLLVDGQCVILRSTVYPGTTSKLADLVAESGRDVRVAFCPERVAEGKAMHELTEFPQIVSGCDPTAEQLVVDLFSRIAKSVIRLSPLEAEFTKIFANVWRYIQFATANQFFMVATDHGLDFFRIHDALTPRLPAHGRPSHERVRRRSLPFQRHDATGSRDSQRIRDGPCRDVDQRGPSQFRCPSSQSAVCARSDACRHSGDGVQS